MSRMFATLLILLTISTAAQGREVFVNNFYFDGISLWWDEGPVRTETGTVVAAPASAPYPQARREWTLLPHLVSTNNIPRLDGYQIRSFISGGYLSAEQDSGEWRVGLSQQPVVWKIEPAPGVPWAFHIRLRDNPAVLLHMTEWDGGLEAGIVPDTWHSAMWRMPGHWAPPTGWMASWMSGLRDSITIDELNIPGTHDSGADYGCVAEVGYGYGKNQDMTIRQQLDAGIRYLDIRLRPQRENRVDAAGGVYTHYQLLVHHGACYQQKSFGDVMREVNAFLDAHPSETVLMRLKEEWADDGTTYFGLAFDYWVARTGGYFDATTNPAGRFYCDSTIPPIIPQLAMVRGKVIILSQNHNVRCMSWNGSGVSPNEARRLSDLYFARAAAAYGAGGSLTYVEDPLSWPVFRQEFETTLELANNHAGTIFVNQIVELSGSHPWIIAEALAPMIGEYVFANPNRFYGTIAMDFPTQSTISHIIGSNRLELYK